MWIKWKKKKCNEEKECGGNKKKECNVLRKIKKRKGN
jgi:hypothetical protein